jgi:hypothetical protein
MPELPSRLLTTVPENFTAKQPKSGESGTKLIGIIYHASFLVSLMATRQLVSYEVSPMGVVSAGLTE